jgi:hypothetical protein
MQEISLDQITTKCRREAERTRSWMISLPRSCNAVSLNPGGRKYWFRTFILR